MRSITIIKAGGDLSRARIRGSIAPDEVLSLCDDSGKGFLDCDPREGFSVRNFHIQAAKMAQVSDIIVYGDDKTDHRIIKSVAERCALVQRTWRKELESTGQLPETYNTFVLTDPFDEFEKSYPEWVAVDSEGRTSEDLVDFLLQERREMSAMSKASEISKGVWQGPSPDFVPTAHSETFDLYIEASDHASMPDEAMLASKLKLIEDTDNKGPVHLLIPSSGSVLPLQWSQAEVDGLIQLCTWLYNLTHHSRPQSVEAAKDEDGDIQMTELHSRNRRVLLHCADGYTETSMFAVAYYMFAEGLPVHEAWVQLHRDKGRNFFAYPSDVALLISIQERILSASLNYTPPPSPAQAPAWLTKLDGSLPSRILPYMYLGNLTHANNPELLKLLGIKRILSVGEPVSWPKSDLEAWGRENLFMVDRVQDNGIDELTCEIDRCLEFISKLYTQNRQLIPDVPQGKGKNKAWQL
jgi:dual specificity MAP kinase phosphatase